MPEQHIPLIMEFIDKIVSPDDRKRKFTDRQIVKILILLQMFRISYRSSAIFLRNHEESMKYRHFRHSPGGQDHWICIQSTGKLPLFIPWNPLPPLIPS
jgi:hypothetical protein